MSTFESNSQSISYGEYKATKSKGIKSQIYSSEINTTNISVNTPIKFSKILPVKVLPTISNDEYVSKQSGINLDINNFSTNDNFDLKPTPTLDPVQNFENNLQSNENIVDTNLDLNSLSINNELTSTTNVETAQTFDASAFQTTESTPTIDINALQETANIDTNTYQSSEPIIDTQTTTNTFTSEINTNVDINNLQTSEPIIDTNVTTTNDNIDINALTTTNVETAQTFDASAFQTTESTPSFDINTLQEKKNIDINTYQSSEPIIDTQATTTTDLNTFSSEINTNVDINNLQTSEPIVDTTATTTNDNFDLNALAKNIEIPQTFDASALKTTELTSYQSSEPIIDKQTTTTNTFSSEINTNVDINNLQTSEPIIDTNVATTNDNIDLNTFATTSIEAESTPSFDINALQETANIDTTNAFQPIENTNLDLKAFTNTENTEETFDINNIKSSEPVINTPLETGIESTPTFDINSLNINQASITNLEPKNYELNNFNIDMANVIDTTSALQTKADFEIKAFETTDVNYQTSNDNIIDTTSALQTTATSNEFDINAFLNANNNVDTDINIGSNTNIESNNILESSSFQATTNTTNILESTPITNLENISSNIPSFDINALTTNVESQSQPALNIQEYQSTSTTVNNYSEILPNPIAEKKIEFSIVTPLQGKIAKGVKENEKITAKVTVLPNYGMATYRPYEGKNNELNFGTENKSILIQSEYKSSTFNPKKGML